MKGKILLLFTLFLYVSSVSAQSHPYGDVLKRKRDTMKELQVTSEDIIFLGNSITEGGNWTEFFDDKHVKNRGIGGDRAEWLFDRVDYLIGAQPRKLFLMIGINDINGGRSPESVVRDITRLVDMWRAGSPGTVIYVHSILPQNDDILPAVADKMALVPIANAGIKKMCDERGITYIDLHPVLADANGKLNAEYSFDGLHLNIEGYLKWADHIRPYVK